MGNDIPHKYPFSYEGPSWHAAVVKLVHIQRNQIFVDGKCLEHCHIQYIGGDAMVCSWLQLDKVSKMQDFMTPTGKLQLCNNGLTESPLMSPRGG
jgi:hypothetical protein